MKKILLLTLLGVVSLHAGEEFGAGGGGAGGGLTRTGDGPGAASDNQSAAQNELLETFQGWNYNYTKDAWAQDNQDGTKFLNDRTIQQQTLSRYILASYSELQGNNLQQIMQALGFWNNFVNNHTDLSESDAEYLLNNILKEVDFDNFESEFCENVKSGLLSQTDADYQSEFISGILYLVHRAVRYQGDCPGFAAPQVLNDFYRRLELLQEKIQKDEQVRKDKIAYDALSVGEKVALKAKKAAEAATATASNAASSARSALSTAWSYVPSWVSKKAEPASSVSPTATATATATASSVSPIAPVAAAPTVSPAAALAAAPAATTARVVNTNRLAPVAATFDQADYELNPREYKIYIPSDNDSDDEDGDDQEDDEDDDDQEDDEDDDDNKQ